MRTFGLMALLAIQSTTASASETGALVRTHGYISPQFQAVTRPDARHAEQSRDEGAGHLCGIVLLNIFSYLKNLLTIVFVKVLSMILLELRWQEI